LTHGFALKTLIENLLRQALAALPEDLVPAAARTLSVEVENTRDAQHGDSPAISPCGWPRRPGRIRANWRRLW